MQKVCVWCGHPTSPATTSFTYPPSRAIPGGLMLQNVNCDRCTNCQEEFIDPQIGDALMDFAFDVVEGRAKSEMVQIRSADFQHSGPRRT